MTDDQPPVPTPPDGVHKPSWNHGFQTACRYLAQQSMTVAKTQAQTHPPPENDSDDENKCPECGGEIVPGIGSRTCVDCGYKDE